MKLFIEGLVTRDFEPALRLLLGARSAKVLRIAGDRSGTCDRGDPAENALRSIVLGRRNWLFAGSDRGGRKAATRCTFIASCRRHELDPFAYLRDVLTRIAACPINQIDQFLPDRWQAAHIAAEA